MGQSIGRNRPAHAISSLAVAHPRSTLSTSYRFLMPESASGTRRALPVIAVCINAGIPELQ
jgi:hypothetical protein